MAYAYFGLEAIIYMLLAVPVVFWFWYQWKFRKQLNFARKLPTVTSTWPLIGHVMQCQLRHILDPSEIVSYYLLDFALHASEENIDHYCLWLGPKPYITTANPEDIKVVLTKQLEKGEEVDCAKFALGNGILTGPATIWKPTRKAIQPMFHSRNLDYMISNVNAKSRILVNSMSKCIGNTDLKEFESIVYKSTTSATLDFIYGSEIEFLDRTMVENHANEAFKSWFDLWELRTISLFSRIDVFFHIIYRKSIADSKKKSIFITHHANKVLPQKVANFKDEESLRSVLGLPMISDMGRGITMSDAFAPLMVANKSVLNKDFENNVATVLAGGSKSTSFVISTCCLMLAIHQHVQDKVYDEIVTCVGDTKEDIDQTDIKKLIYLDQVIKETMRLFPAFPVYSRRLTNDTKLSFGMAPAGSQITINAYGAHMNPKVYPNPLAFDPDRFSAENVLKRHKFSFIPFSAGPRNCIGKDFAALAMKVYLVQTLREYRFTSTSQMKDIELSCNIELKIKNGCQIALSKRH